MSAGSPPKIVKSKNPIADEAAKAKAHQEQLKAEYYQRQKQKKVEVKK